MYGQRQKIDRWTKWDERRFENSLKDLIRGAGGCSDKIEDLQNPGNADLVYSMPSREEDPFVNPRTGFIELKKTVEFKPNCKLRLKHPLSADQRNFLTRHGERGAVALVGVLFVHGDYRRNTAAFWSWHHMKQMFAVPLSEAIGGYAKWYGNWPITCRGEGELYKQFRDMLYHG